MMENRKKSEFYTSSKISTPFKVFIGVFLIAGLAFIGYHMYKEGEELGSIASLLFATILGAVLLFWVFSKIKRIHDLTNLSEVEKSYVNDLANMKATSIIRKYVFSNMDIQPILAFIVIIGDMVKKMLFYIFIGGLLLLFIYGDNTIFDKIIMLSLAIIWCPWAEALLLRKIDYKLTFLSKLVLTIIVFSIAIKTGS